MMKYRVLRREKVGRQPRETHIISVREDLTAEGGKQRQLSGGMQEAEPWRTQGEPQEQC